MTMKKALIAGAVMTGIFTAPVAPQHSEEHPAGEPVKMNEMELAAVYLQPIDMEPRGMGLPAAKSDIHRKPIFTPPKATKTVLARVNGCRI